MADENKFVHGWIDFGGKASPQAQRKAPFYKMMGFTVGYKIGICVKFIIDNWMLLAVAFASGAMLIWPVVQGATNAGLSAAGAVQLINREKAVVIDVCEASEYAAGHVGGAKNIPLGQLEEKLPGLVKNKSVPIILVWRWRRSWATSKSSPSAVGSVPGARPACPLKKLEST